MFEFPPKSLVWNEPININCIRSIWLEHTKYYVSSISLKIYSSTSTFAIYILLLCEHFCVWIFIRICHSRYISAMKMTIQQYTWKKFPGLAEFILLLLFSIAKTIFFAYNLNALQAADLIVVNIFNKFSVTLTANQKDTTNIYTMYIQDHHLDAITTFLVYKLIEMNLTLYIVCNCFSSKINQIHPQPSEWSLKMNFVIRLKFQFTNIKLDMSVVQNNEGIFNRKAHLSHNCEWQFNLW